MIRRLQTSPLFPYTTLFRSSLASTMLCIGPSRPRLLPIAREARRPVRVDGSSGVRSEEHTSELQSPCNLVCRLLLEKTKDHARNLALKRRVHADLTTQRPTS